MRFFTYLHLAPIHSLRSYHSLHSHHSLRSHHSLLFHYPHSSHHSLHLFQIHEVIAVTKERNLVENEKQRITYNIINKWLQ